MPENQEVSVREEDPFSQFLPGEGILEFIERQEHEASVKKVRDDSFAAMRDRLEHYKTRIIFNYTRQDKPKAIKSMSQKYGISEFLIRHALKDWKVPKRKGFVSAKAWIVKHNRQRIIDWYTKDQLTARQIGDKLGIAESTIQIWLKRWKISARIYKKVDVAKAKEMLSEGYRVEDIAYHLGVRSPVIDKLRIKLFGYGFSTRKVYIGPMTERLIRLLYSRGMTVSQIFRIVKSKGLMRRAESAQPLYAFIDEQRKAGMGTRMQMRRRPWVLSLSDEANIRGLLGRMLVSDISLKLYIPESMINEFIIKNTLVKYLSWKIIPQKQVMASMIRELRQQGHSDIVIAYLTGLNIGSLQYRLAHAKTMPKLKVRQYNEARLIGPIRRMRLEKANVQEIASTLGVSAPVIVRLIRKYNVPYVKKVFDEATRQKIKELYRQDVHPADIAGLLGVKEKSLQLEIQRMGILSLNKPWNIKHHQYSPEETSHQDYLIQKYYDAPYYKSIFSLAKALNMDKDTIRGRLVKLGFRIRSNAEGKALRKVSKSPIIIPPAIRGIIFRRKYQVKEMEWKQNQKKSF